MRRVVFRDVASEQWLEFSDLVDCYEVHEIDQVTATLEKIESRVNSEKLFAAGFISYEASPAFDPACEVRFDAGFPLLHFGLFRKLGRLSSLDDGKNTDLEWQMDSAPQYYASKIDAIKKRIHAGDTYQVNFTVRQHAKNVSDAWSLFKRLGPEAPHAAFIETDSWAICSASPELFFSLEGKTLRSRPMKGTAPRGETLREDEENKSWLRNSEKNRAENLMIVDMIRNDLGRVATPGSVEVENLFRIETYPTVLQMTTGVVAQTDSSVADILRALFPCASITGAPKINTMRFIAQLEDSPRRIYTGSMGYILPGRKAQFNVAIRTALVNKKNQSASYGVGGGIVWDSTAREELAEIATKSQILGRADRQNYFDLLESLLWNGREFALLDRHCARIKYSAKHFGFLCSEQSIREHLQKLSETLPSDACKVRLLLSYDGNLKTEHAPLAKTNTDDLEIRLAQFPIDAHSIWLAHKTTVRQIYDEAKSWFENTDDVLLWNQYGNITESTIANILFERDGGLTTPEISDGLLPGTLRAETLLDGHLTESTIAVSDLKKNSNLHLFNSVRGVYRVKLKR